MKLKKITFNEWLIQKKGGYFFIKTCIPLINSGEDLKYKYPELYYDYEWDMNAIDELKKNK